MFIVHYKNGDSIIGKDRTWDSIEDGVTGIDITLPFPVKQKLADGSLKDLPSRIISISGYDRYFYSKEAVSKFATNGENTPNMGQNLVVAEIAGGIKDELGIVFQIRVSREGNIKTTTFPLSSLEISERAIKNS